MRLVLLWFGSWKNSMSCYAPAWVKRDQARFRAAWTPAAAASRSCRRSRREPRHRRACLAALMRHLKAFDGEAHTVVMVQVENEIGMIPSAGIMAPTPRCSRARYRRS